VLLFPGIIAIGVLAGYAFGGRLTNLALMRWRSFPLVGIAIAMQVALSLRPLRNALGDHTWDAVVTSYALIGLWLVLNIRHRRGLTRAGVGLAAAGWLLNVIVMVPNRGMPVSAAGLDAAGAPPDLKVSSGHLYKHVLASHSSVLRPLGDVIPLRLLHTVISAGDVVMLVGIATIVAAGMRTTETETERAEAAAEIEAAAEPATPSDPPSPVTRPALDHGMLGPIGSR
jgi:hypothetical protein